MIKEYRQKRKERRAAKKADKKGRRINRWKIFGCIMLVIGLFLGASIFAIVDMSNSLNVVMKKYDSFVDELSVEINLDTFVVSPIVENDYTQFINKCENAGINILKNEAFHKDELTLSSAVSFSPNEIGSYINKKITNDKDAFDIVQCSIFAKNEHEYIETICKITLSEVNEDVSEVEDMPEAIYLTTTSELYRVRNRVQLKNSVNRINQISDELNNEIFEAIMGEDFDAVDSMMNGVFAESINDLLDRTSATLSIQTIENNYVLTFTPRV